MSITIYGIKNCSTMKKAFDKLTALGLEYEFFDYKKQAINKPTLAHWVETVGIDKIMNSKGTTYRKLSDAQKAQIKQDVDAALDMMVAQPSMIKRPIVVSNNELIIGFDETAFEKLGM
ncbi:Spx/MgsR family RNA polymerase-binding regulatory protein [Moraxella osloensis]|jgi:Spx/MgsR family transcriptional regulator|uniref:Spx/MgsR family RNA polymerase-binding regulatory protein n=1 Tax=Moraxella sp. CTOTU49803 TaxID=2953840 RepID=UPI0024ACF940|nr:MULTISPECIES: Spx/MgsR family RNA polymerase-binding regulatory protein [Moraxella]MDI4480406.1 Spx/MgsR family RNA polymerase-binding regulatory protein [Moraxella osloensis]MDK1669581.1 Spx/MgsR family RNA polymerase-binding regulatory protein [Moraxella osloensis]